MKKPSRNDPCPCGSGNKYKKCCEAKQVRKSWAVRKFENLTSTNPAEITGLFKTQLTSDAADSSSRPCPEPKIESEEPDKKSDQKP
jgi:hypothetical protein